MTRRLYMMALLPGTSQGKLNFYKGTRKLTCPTNMMQYRSEGLHAYLVWLVTHCKCTNKQPWACIHFCEKLLAAAVNVGLCFAQRSLSGTYLIKEGTFEGLSCSTQISLSDTRDNRCDSWYRRLVNVVYLFTKHAPMQWLIALERKLLHVRS